MDDRAIIALFWKRDERAIREFEAAYRPLCMTIAREITGDRGAAEECCNDACLRLWNSIPPQKPLSLKAYASRIIRNLALNRAEKENARKRSAVLVELEECAAAELPDLDAPEVGRMLDAFLETLPPLQVKLFVRRYYYSEPVGEIAARLGIKENKASKLLAKTRTALRKFLLERGITVE